MVYEARMKAQTKFLASYPTTMMDFNDLDGGFDDSDDDYDFENWTTLDLDDAGDAVVGRLEAVIENVGQYDSTAYLIECEDDDVLVWGNASINAGFENSDAEPGDMLGVRNTGETYSNDYGEFAQYEVRFKKAEDDE